MCLVDDEINYGRGLFTELLNRICLQIKLLRRNKFAISFYYTISILHLCMIHTIAYVRFEEFGGQNFVQQSIFLTLY